MLVHLEMFDQHRIINEFYQLQVKIHLILNKRKFTRKIFII